MRIITGSAKGTRLLSPKNDGTRPTADRIKESVFNILGDRVRERVVLDLFSGTGNLGIESLSRGAKSATFIDFATDKLIRENLKRAHLEEKGEVFRADVFKKLKTFEAKRREFDLIFIDPPYFKNLSQKTMEFLNFSPIFSGNGIIVVEYGIGEKFSNYDKLENFRDVAYGKTTGVSFWMRVGGEETK
ncbi:MAG: 16S rRNA (guanine(966)-N(2))-methyltransferase RsmD [Selenomonadaceae bacterium]|nr:16S rRNA (guanine(966)-N(2))-methyltransferase RsmD [Selenomonadaceae bacterium]